MKKANVVLLDSNTLFRQGLKNILSSYGFAICSDGVDDGEVLKYLRRSVSPDLILFDLPDRADAAALVRRLAAAAPNAHLVFLGSSLSGERFYDMLAAGARGFLMKSLAIESLVESLRLVMMGEIAFPSALFRILQGEPEPEAVEPTVVGDARLSMRELQVLQGLGRGECNKAIANALGITGDTVKIHLKTLMRKIGCSNRTQAAVWAFNHGLQDPQEPANQVVSAPAAVARPLH